VDGTAQFPRFALASLAEAAADSPAVYVHGARQCGKTTLVQQFGRQRGYTYLTFDDAAVLAAARADPAGFAADLPPRAILDEVQRVPGLMPSLKLAIDRQREPGRLVLTGSADVLAAGQIAESLAGRVAAVRLHPLAQCELAGQPSAFLDRLLGEGFTMATTQRLGAQLLPLVVAGGYPAALRRTTEGRRAAWYRDYHQSLIDRDVRELARIQGLSALPRLLAACAAQTAGLFNASDLAAPFALSRPTISDYLVLLQRVFLIHLLPPWHHHALSRLVKTPKLHIGDSGLACALLGLDSASIAKDRQRLGPLLETFVVQELRRMASWRAQPLELLHFRDKEGAEVDCVLAAGEHAVAGVEVKAGATVTAADFAGLRKLQAAAGDAFRGGAVVYDGEVTLPFGPQLWAVPLARLWEAAEATAGEAHGR